jgi:hypothetical protein
MFEEVNAVEASVSAEVSDDISSMDNALPSFGMLYSTGVARLGTFRDSWTKAPTSCKISIV